MRQRFSVALSSGYDGDKFLGVQLRAFGDNPGAGHTQVMHSFGFASRPVDPTSNDDGLIGCIVQQISRGTAEEFAYLAHDPRYISKIPPLSQGSSCQYASNGSFVLLDAVKETEQHYIPYLDSGTIKAHSITFGKDANSKPSIEMRHGDGMYVQLVDEKAIVRAKGNAYLEVKGDTITANGNTKVPGSLDVGGPAALPAAMATPLVSYLTALEAVLATISAATMPTTSAAVVAFVAESAALKAAIPAQFLKGL